MLKEEAIRKMEFCKNAYQKLIDEEVDQGTFVGNGVNGAWKADTPLTKAYSDMVDACEMAIEALGQEPKVIRCKECIHNNDCSIQYHAQAGDMFYCGAAESEDGEWQKPKISKL